MLLFFFVQGEFSIDYPTVKNIFKLVEVICNKRTSDRWDHKLMNHVEKEL